MGVFDDKKFDELDWISQATEPIDSELNNYLTQLPDEVNIDFNMFSQIVKDRYNMHISVDKVLSYLLSQQFKTYTMNDTRSHLIPCFKLEMEGDIILNFETSEMTGGTIKLVKIQHTMDEKVLSSILGREGIHRMAHMRITNDGMSRANEVMELLAKCDDGIRTRSERKKLQAMRNRLTQIFKNNEWNIRDTELANKVGKWIESYVVDGNLAAFSNFCRLKVMTHKSQPIYSMEEIS